MSFGNWRLRCDDCGCFIGKNNTHFGGVYFGGPEDMEPPEARYLCDKCEAAEIAEARKSGRMPTRWVTADWEAPIAAELGFRWAALPGAAWGAWRRELPDGWEWVEVPDELK